MQQAIRSKHIVTPEGIRPGVILINEEKITAVEPESYSENAGRCIDAGAAGGYTCLVDMPLNSIPSTINVAALDEKRRAAKAKAYRSIWSFGERSFQGDTGSSARPGGISSLSLSLPAIWTEARSRGFTINDVVRWMSKAPAKLAGMGSRKGGIAPGLDADVVIFDPAAERGVCAARLYFRADSDWTSAERTGPSYSDRNELLFVSRKQLSVKCYKNVHNPPFSRLTCAFSSSC